MNELDILKRDVILLPSCVYPLVQKNISNLNPEKNLIDLNSNIKNLFDKVQDIKSKFEIVIADCSKDFNLSINDIYMINDFSNVKIINITFNDDELHQISLKGKGFCEILMIKHALNQLQLSNNCNIHKLTARYSLIFPNFLLNYHSNLVQNNDIVILFSYIFKTTSCHFFTIKKGYLLEIIDQILVELDDYNGKILEKVLFFFIKNNNLFKNKAKRSRIFSYYSSNLKPGSSLARKGSSNYIYQFLRNIAFII